MAQWNSLYLQSADTQAVINTLNQTLTAPAYEIYDPFGARPIVRAITDAVRLFVAPPQGGWTRLITAPDAPADETVKRALSQHGLLIAAAIDGADASIQAYKDGAPVDVRAALAAFGGGDSLENALVPVKPDRRGKIPMVVPEDALPKMLKVDAGRFGRLADKISGRALKPHEKQAAGAFLNDVLVDWASPAGQQIVALLLLLKVPGWVEPEYAPLRDAYALLTRRSRNPNIRLLPGDQQILDARPDALDYVPFFARIVK